MLIASEGFDYLVTGSTQATRLLGALGWYQMSGTMEISSFTRFSYGKSLKAAAGSNISVADWVWPGGPQIQEGFFGVAVYIANENENDYPRIQLNNALNSEAKLSVTFLPYGVVRLSVGGVDQNSTGTGGGAALGPVIFTSLPGTWLTNTWFYIELGWYLSDNTIAPDGELELRLNTVPIAHYVNVVTSQTSVLAIDSVRVGQNFLSSPNSVYWDDMYVCDSATGPTPDTNTFLGNVRAMGILPTGPTGATINWSRSNTGMTNWENASNTSVDDSLYVYTPDVGDLDLYHINPVVNSPDIFGVCVKGAYRQDTSTQRFAANTILPTGATGPIEGDSKALNSNYSFSIDLWEENPVTSLQWTDVEVNQLQIGPKVTA